MSSGGNLANAYFIGTAGNEEAFDTYSILDSNTFQLAELGNDSGDGFLRLGRKDGNASTPYIYFNSASAASDYDVALIASGGDANNGQGSLDVKVADENQLTVNASIVWNAGNVAFNSANVVSTTSLKSAVMRDTLGNFTANVITASLTGAASLNVKLAGDTMTGPLSITGDNNLTITGSGALSVGGNATVGANLTVDSGTLFVDAANNKVTVGSATSGLRKFNVVDNPSSTLAFQGNVRLSSNSDHYQATFHQKSSGGSAGLLLMHNDTGAAPTGPVEWGISVERASAYVGKMIFRTSTGASASATRLEISSAGDVTPGATDAQHMGTSSRRWSAVYSNYTETKTSIRIGDAGSNAGADLQFKGAASGAGGGRSWRMGNALNSGADVFEISASDSLGGTDWRTALSPTPGSPLMAFNGATNAVAINTDQFSGTDTTTDPNTVRDYILNVEGDVNFNGQLFQNNAEFVTSRWTEATNGTDIYRLSKVGVNKADPQYELDITGGVNVAGQSFSNGQNAYVLRANGDKQWIDTYGVFKANRNTVAEDVTIPSNTNCMTAGPITINNGSTIVISSDASWSIV